MARDRVIPGRNTPSEQPRMGGPGNTSGPSSGNLVRYREDETKRDQVVKGFPVQSACDTDVKEQRFLNVESIGQAMQPSTWNDNNQHWTPQFLLKGFGLKRKASRVLQMDKATGEIEVRKVSEVASKQGLLTDADDELMGRIEREANPVIDKIRKGTTRIDRRERKGLDRLIAALLQNDPYSGPDWVKMREESIASTAQAVVADFAESRLLVNEESIKQYADELCNHDYLKLTFERKDNQILTVLGFMGLTANYSTEEGPFIIGDSPVLAVRNSVLGTPSLQNRGSQVILPISNKCLLVYQWATSRNLLDKGRAIDKQQALSINRDYYHGSNCRFLYGRTRDSLERSRMLQLHYVPGERSTEVSDGWHAMQAQLREQDERDRAQEVADKEEFLAQYAKS